MFGDEPDLWFVGAVITGFIGRVGIFMGLPQDDFMRLQQTRQPARCGAGPETGDTA